jgi:hypothetical protein
MTGLKVKTAWADAEHMRLAMCRSPWDETVNPVQHGPLPADEDPWLADEGRAWNAVQAAGHLDCGAWSQDGEDAPVICVCGTRIQAGAA